MHWRILSSVLLLLSITVAQALAFSHGSVATVYVDPEESTVCVGETFTVDVNVQDVLGLQGFDFCLLYDDAILYCLGVEEGPFMAGSGFSIFVIDKTTVGRVWFAVLIYGVGFVNGSGTLATITFNATAPGESTLNLHSILPDKPDEIKLITCDQDPIPNTAVDGHVVVSSHACDPSDPSPDPPADPPDPDLNGDRVIDILDAGVLASTFGSSKGESRYRLDADFDQNDSIDMLDVAILAANFGRVS